MSGLNARMAYELGGDKVMLTENEINVIRNAVENYICTIKVELTEEQRKFNGYERCSNIKTIIAELDDAERARAILKKASEK